MKFIRLIEIYDNETDKIFCEIYINVDIDKLRSLVKFDDDDPDGLGGAYIFPTENLKNIGIVPHWDITKYTCLITSEDIHNN